MTYRITLVASVVAVGVAFVPIAGGTAGQAQRVAIQSKGSVYSFTLKPVGTGRLRADVGKTTWNGSSTRTVIRNGQSVEIETVLGTFVGQRGRFARHPSDRVDERWKPIPRGRRDVDVPERYGGLRRA